MRWKVNTTAQPYGGDRICLIGQQRYIDYAQLQYTYRDQVKIKGAKNLKKTLLYVLLVVDMYGKVASKF